MGERKGRREGGGRKRKGQAMRYLEKIEKAGGREGGREGREGETYHPKQ